MYPTGNANKVADAIRTGLRDENLRVAQAVSANTRTIGSYIAEIHACLSEQDKAIEALAVETLPLRSESEQTEAAGSPGDERASITSPVVNELRGILRRIEAHSRRLDYIRRTLEV